VIVSAIRFITHHLTAGQTHESTVLDTLLIGADEQLFDAEGEPVAWPVALAGDKGATVSVTREFANGWRIGAFATKTDLSAEQFGEGSFDKGISLSIPITWATGQPTRDRASTTLRSLSRDGGARVDVSGRLYDRVRDAQDAKLYDGWGRFWR